MKIAPCRLGGAWKWLVAGSLLVMTACASRSGEVPTGAVYPARASSGSIDIQVVREETTIRMTNTTAKVLPAGRMWANRWYSREFPGLGVGESLTLGLSEFKDQYGEAFRAGGFFATDRPLKLVQAELECGEEVIGLVVVGAAE